MENKYKLMSAKILVIAKLKDQRFITREELKKSCKLLGASYYSMISYLLSNNYLVRIFRGLFYINTLEERKEKTPDIDFYSTISEALKLKGVKNWYFGLETAIKLNNLTHEYFTTDFIISDTLKRPRPIDILGHKVRFLKAKKTLFGFGIKTGKFPYSDIEKTVLDIVYFGVYNNKSEDKIKNSIIDYLDKCDKKKLAEYSKFYPKTLLKFTKNRNDK